MELNYVSRYTSHGVRVEIINSRTWISALLLCCTFILYNCGHNTKDKIPPLAENGVLDLRGWDFTIDGPVELNGEWKFVWMEDSPRFIQPEFDDAKWENYSVPSSWMNNNKEKLGYAWYRLKVLLNPDNGLGIYLYASRTAYVMYINGKISITNGKAGTSEQSTVPEQKPDILAVPHDEELVLAWKISNFHEDHNSGGPVYSPVIGDIREMNDGLLNMYFFNSLVLGVILMMAVYHILLWLGRREDKSSILFALFCFLIFFRMLGTSLFLHRFFSGDFIYHIRIKIEYIGISMGWVVFIAFLSTIFPHEFKNKLLRVFQLAGIGLSLLVLAMPTRIATMLLLYIQIVLLLVVGWTLYSIIRAFLRKRSEAGIVLCGIAFLLLTILNDLLYSHLIIRTAYIFQIGLVVFIFCISAILSTRFAKAYQTSRHLSLNLQEEVSAQTKIITKKNQELTRLNREKTDYFINLAHETKTPLTLILNYLNRYTKRTGSDPDLNVISRNIEKLKKDMINFLDFEKLERGQDFYDHRTVTDLSEAVADAVKLFSETAALKKVRLHLTNEEGIYVHADPYAIGRIINNLIDNALKFTDHDGEVAVQLQNEGEKAILSVTDTGIGMSDAQLDNIFQAYHQISHEKRNIQGIGMGLNIVKKILGDIGGTITVTSSPGEGSCFRVTLQLCVPDGAPAATTGFAGNETGAVVIAETQDLTDTAFDPGKRSLLIVEDNPDMLAYLKGEFREEWNVYCARNGAEALRKLSMVPKVQGVISDIMMDVMDGYTLYEELKKNERYAALPVIFLTAKNTQLEKLSALQKGVVDYVHKPFDIEELKAKIGAVVAVTEKQFEDSRQELIRHIVTYAKHGGAGEDLGTVIDREGGRFDLSEREKEIVMLLMTGKINKEIADALHISVNTVKTHVASIYRKCGVQNKIEMMNIFKTK
ncbi:MAG TPA: response regulator [Spirochaetia bacterium]|nr:response regulator [Spirochaetia bacterium]